MDMEYLSESPSSATKGIGNPAEEDASEGGDGISDSFD